MLSKRLEQVASMVTKGNIIADIGTDHGYVPIYLVEKGICPKAYAMDINQGPIESAIKNIENYGLSEKIQAIKSNGIEKQVSPWGAVPRMGAKSCAAGSRVGPAPPLGCGRSTVQSPPRFPAPAQTQRQSPPADLLSLYRQIRQQWRCAGWGRS